MSERQFIPSNIIFQIALLKKIKVIGRVGGPKKIGVYMYKSISQKSYADIQISKTLLNKYINNKNYKKYISEGLKLVKGILYVKKQNFDFNIVMSRQKSKFIKLKRKFLRFKFRQKKPTCFIFSHNLLMEISGKSILIYNDYLSWLRKHLNASKH